MMKSVVDDKIESRPASPLPSFGMRQLYEPTLGGFVFTQSDHQGPGA